MLNKLLLIFSVVLVLGCFDLFGAEGPDALTDYKEKVSYAIGVETVRNFKNKGVDFDLDMVLKGMKDGLAGTGTLISEKELRSVLISVQSELRRKQSAANKALSQDSHNNTGLAGR